MPATTHDESPNRYLAGNYAPVTDEVTETDLPVTGRLPWSSRGAI